jgi:hypothetical protein
MWDEDDKKRIQAWGNMGYDVTLGWTKGLFGFGFTLEVLKNKMIGFRYGETADNWVRVFDDLFGFADAAHRLVTKPSEEDLKGMSKKEAERQKEKIRKAWGDVWGSALALTGNSQVFFDRIYDVKTDPFYDDAAKKMLRAYGASAGTIKNIYPTTPGKNKPYIERDTEEEIR